jgi:hypothetical protein
MHKGIIVLLILSALAAAQTQKKGPVIFVNGSGGVTIQSSGFAASHVAAGSTSVSKHDQTIEMVAQLMKSCPDTEIVIQPDLHADYELYLNRETGGWGTGVSQIILVRSSSHAVLHAGKQGTVAKAMKEACKAIFADWNQQSVPGQGAQ